MKKPTWRAVLCQWLSPILLIAATDSWAQCDFIDPNTANSALGNPAHFSWTANGIQSRIPISSIKQTANIHLPCSNDTWQWFEATMYLDFNTSSANYVDLLYRFDSSLQTGWVLRLGDVDDGIKLIERKAGKERIECAGEAGYFNKTKSNITVRWVKQHTLMLLLYKDSSWEQYRTLCAAIDTLNPKSNHCGLSIIQTGSGAAGKHRFTTLIVQPPRPDKTPPTFTSLLWKSTAWAQLNFSEPVFLQNKNQLICNFQQADTFFPISSKSLLAKFPQQPCNKAHTVYVQNAQDSAGNIQAVQQRNQILECPTPIQPYQITFTEIMADPNPSVGQLPAAQYIELKNHTETALWLSELTLSDGQTTTALPKYLIPPQARITLCHYDDSTLFKGIPHLIPCKLPYLNIETETLTLTNSQQQIIHQFTYHKYMHQPGYENGGYSLEHADSATPCKDLFLWHSNTHLGGTPSQPNHPPKPFPSIKHPNGTPPQPFQIAYIAATHPDTLLMEFTDPISTTTPTLFTATHPVAHTFTPIAQNPLKYHIQPPLITGEALPITVKFAKNCHGLSLRDSITTVAYAENIPEPGELQFNEVMFNALDHLPDYVEVVNTSNKPLQLQGLQLQIEQPLQPPSINTLQPTPFVLYPNQLRCYSNQSYRLALANEPSQYQFLGQVNDFPNLPADQATLKLLHPLAQQIDEMQYDESMHTPILPTNKGVSLEKNHPSAPSHQPNHWVSATITAGYATPGSTNSQSTTLKSAPKKKPFYPEKTIYLLQTDERITLFHKLSVPGYLVTVELYSLMGNSIPLRIPPLEVSTDGAIYIPLHTLKNQIPSGNYILHVDAFHPDADLCRQNIRLVLLQNN